MLGHSPFAARRWNGRSISGLSLAAFAAVLCIILGSNRYVVLCVQREVAAQTNRAQLSALGQELADASDYLTDEVRKYAVTGDIAHLKNYWDEVEVDRRRDTVIRALEGCGLPESESALLAQAKRHSDLLIDTETRSMQLTLRARGQSVADFTGDEAAYVARVMAYPLTQDDLALSARDMRDTALKILYDAAYVRAKTQIMTPIEQFQAVTAERLAREAARATAGRENASALQIACSVLSLLLTAVLLWTLTRLYILPMAGYTAEFASAPRDTTRMHVTPSGAYEPYRFGQLFNRLGNALARELESRRQAETEMRLARDEADKASNAKSEFLAQMSHELRTPLGAVTGYLYLLEQTGLDAVQRRYCGSMRASADSLLGQINDILDFSKIEAGSVTFEQIDFDLAALADEIRDILELTAQQKGLYFRLALTGELPALVRGDPTKLRQVLINLAGNAVKFTNTGGVTLSISVEMQDETGCTAAFSVADTGIGITLEDQGRIFEPFVQGDAGVTRQYGGTGLGLVIARRTVEAASGGAETLTVESEPGHGTIFRFRMRFLPASDAVEALPKAAAQAIDGGKTVLVIDDNEINLDMESEVLRSFGLAVETARNGAEALRKTAARVFDLVLLDIRMPDMDGYAAARAMRKNPAYRTVPMLALTADAVAGVREKALAAGMNDYVTKPLKPPALYRLLQRYFALAASAPEVLATDEGRLFREQEALRALGGSRTQLADLCARFVRAHGRSADYIRIHLENGRAGTARAILHDLIGLTGNLCCDRLCALSRALLDEIHQGRSDLLPRFCDLFTRTVAELLRFSETNGAAPRRQKGDRPVAQTLQMLCALCKDYDWAAAELFETERDRFRAALPPWLYRHLEQAIGRYDFSAAAMLLEQGKGGL